MRQSVDHFVRDAQYGFRVLRRPPVFTAVAIPSLALGIGANAAIFQLVDTVRFRSLPVSNPQELAKVHADGISTNADMTDPLWQQVRDHQAVPMAQNPGLSPWALVIVCSNNADPAGIRSAIAQRVAKLNPAIVVQFTELKSLVRERLVTERMLLALGLLIGLPLAVATMRGAATLLFCLSPTDLTTMVIAGCVLSAAAGLAGSIPARRAARVNPGITLRCD